MDNKSTELILFEKFPVADIISLRSDSKSKNIVNISVRKQKEKEIEIEIEKKKGKRPSIHTDLINIVLDFSSVNDSKLFINSFKKIIIEFKRKFK